VRDVGDVFHKLLADTLGSASSASISGGTGNTWIKYALYLLSLAFPIAVGAFATFSPFGL
jgi:hypothetical protein